MKLLDYLEYMTPKEKENAFKAGQTNLIHAKEKMAKINNENAEYQKFYKKIKQEYDNYYRRDEKFIFENSLASKDICRICLTHNEYYVSCKTTNAIHQDLIINLWAHKHLSDVPINYKDIGFVDQIACDWWRNSMYFKYFINLVYVRKDKEIYLSESYKDNMIDFNSEIYKHYNSLTKKLFKKKLTTERYSLS